MPRRRKTNPQPSWQDPTWRPGHCAVVIAAVMALIFVLMAASR